MSLTVGTRIGPYEVTAAIGAGGMGEVFRARDTELNRDVAIKVLPAAVSQHPERVARLKREARVVAALSHPNIASIYGLEEAQGTLALVLELVEGEDLAQRLRAGALELQEVIAIARQLAEGLVAAHEKGVVHRDLKPANIKLTADGVVKILDFGLAKPGENEPANDSASKPVSDLPTQTRHMTEAGIILGTAAYMSPEQAAGKSVDRRTDIWAFGVVLFEMLTGRRVFAGETTSHVLAAVLRDAPDWSALPEGTPAGIRKLLRRCLEKDRRKRIADAADVRFELEEATTGALEAMASLEGARRVDVLPQKSALPWAAAGALGVALAAALLLWAPWQTGPRPTPRKLLASIGAHASLPTNRGPSAILSPDGTALAFVARQIGETRLFVRTLDQLQAVELAGTEGAADPFFSPDGKWVAFFAGALLKKVSVTGGAPLTICEVRGGRGGAWTDDDTIVFATGPASGAALMRVSAVGGTPAPLTALSPGAVTQRWPQALPSGAGFLFAEHSSNIDWDAANIVAVPSQGGSPRIVVSGGYFGRYLPSGHLVYLQQGTLFGVRFDLSRLAVVGQAVPVLDDVLAAPASGGAQLALAAEGTFLYMPGAAASRANPMWWAGRDGNAAVLRATRAEWSNPRFSPDGQRVAMDISDGRQRDIWVYDWARDRLAQLTFDPGDDRQPVWSPDGQRIVFAGEHGKGAKFNLYSINADGTGEITRLTESPEAQVPFSWHPSGRFLAFHQNAEGKTKWDLMVLPMEGGASRGNPAPFLATPVDELQPAFSPDGRWIAYSSNEGGTGEARQVYVRPFEGSGGPWRISTAGGAYPRWSPTARELLFVSDGKVLFSSYSVVGDSLRVDKPGVWTPTAAVSLGVGYPYDIHPDGKRLALMAGFDPAGVAQDRVVFISNFFEYVRRTVSGEK